MKIKKDCKQCSTEFEARNADIKRGWGKFCSKSCKALYQEQVRQKVNVKDPIFVYNGATNWDYKKILYSKIILNDAIIKNITVENVTHASRYYSEVIKLKQLIKTIMSMCSNSTLDEKFSDLDIEKQTAIRLML